MIIRKIDDYLVIRVFKENIGDFNIFDIDEVQAFFQNMFKKIQKKYNLNGIIDVDVYIDFEYGMIIEVHSTSSCFYLDEIDMKIHFHLDSVFLVEINTNSLLDYDNVYYYKNKFYSTYIDICDNEVFYKDTENIINYGIKVC